MSRSTVTEGHDRAGRGAGPVMPPPWRLGLLAAAGAIGTSSVAPALNDIVAALDLGEAATAGVLSTYVVVYAAATIVAAQLCDAIGPRRVLRVALALAVAGAVAAAAAADAPVLLAGRAVQGAGAGAVSMVAFDVARRMPGGIARTAAVLTLGASSGPLVGGLASQLVGWQAAVALPALLHLTGLVRLTPPDVGGAPVDRVDARGLVATGLGAALVAAGLQVASLVPGVAAGLAACGGVSLAWAVRRAVRGPGRVPPAPLLVDTVVRRKGLLVATIAAAYFSTLVVVPVALGGVGVSSVGIGLLLLPPAVTGALAARWSASIGSWAGRWTDPVAAAAPVVVLAAVLLAPPVAGALTLVVLAAAYGVVQPPLLAASSELVSDGPATAIGAANLVLLLGGGVGSAMVGGLGATGGGSALLAIGLVVLVVVARGAVRAPGTAAAAGGVAVADDPGPDRRPGEVG